MTGDLFALPTVQSPVITDTHARTGDAELSQFFTPFWVAEELVDDALRGIGSAAVLEPSCGTGSFLTAIPSHMPALGIDIDPKVASAAMKNSGRNVIIGDFRTCDLEGFQPEVLVGNPPFEMAVINGFLDRAHEILPDDGLIAMIVPAYSFQTPRQVTRWMDMFSIEVNMIPRTIFPGLSKPLVWAKWRKQAQRTFSGMMLFAETRSVELMRSTIREALEQPGTWREAVTRALETLGGEASVASIYDAIAPQRQQSEHWRPKVRQTLQRGFVSLGNGRWTLPEMKAA